MKYKVTKRWIHSEIVYVHSFSKEEAEKDALFEDGVILDDDLLYECIVEEVEEVQDEAD